MADVTLESAYVFVCPGCGRRNFVTAVPVEMAEEDVRHMTRHFGGGPDDWKTGEFVSAPDEVDCAGCGGTFTVAADDAIARLEDDDEDFDDEDFDDEDDDLFDDEDFDEDEDEDL